MSKSVTGIIVIIVLVVLGAAGFLLTHNDSPHQPAAKSENMTAMDNHSSQNSSPNPTKTNSVSIANMAFTPPDITVTKGTTVTWTNNDAVTHTVTENDGKTGPDSGDLAPTKTYSFTFNNTGTFKYHCSIHPSMLGTVTVTD